MTTPQQYTPGPANLARVQKDGENWTLVLVRQPLPYMEKIDATIPPPGPPNPYWLSTDTRVFKVTQNSSAHQNSQNCATCTGAGRFPEGAMPISPMSNLLF